MTVPDNRQEFLAVGLLAGVLALFLSAFGTLLSEPASTPFNFVLDKNVRRDGPAALDVSRVSRQAVLRLAFVGDIMQHQAQGSDDFAGSYAKVRDLIASPDIAVGNLEFPVYAGAPTGPRAGSVRFNGSPAHVAALSAAGLDVLSTANNHTFDQGLEGLESTLRLLKKQGIVAVGDLAGPARDQPVVVERNGFRIGFFAYTFRPNSYRDAKGDVRYWQRDWPIHALNFDDWSDEYRAQGLQLIARHARAARELRVDWLVAFVHWGREWEFQPSADQRLAGRDLIDQGFDLVVGSHAHVVNPVEVYRERLIAYSLGNLVSDFGPWQARTGAVLQVDLGVRDRLAITGFRAIPVFTERRGHLVRPVDEAASADERMRDLARQVLGPACAFAAPELSGRRR